jgi:DNA-binding transcriptional MerR regulator
MGTARSSGLTLKSTLRCLIDFVAVLNIGEVAERAGVTAPTVRYYESIGLLKKPPRSEGGYRRYSEATVAELGFIKKARALGFSLEEIGEIVQLTRSGKRPCERVMDLAKTRLQDVDEHMRRLASFRKQLASEIARWETPSESGCDGMCEMIDSSVAEPAALFPESGFKVRNRNKRA